MKKSIMCTMLAIVCLMSGCGKKTENDEKNENSASSLVSETNRVIATVNGKQITESEFNFYLEGVKQQMMGTELSSDEDWETKMINGKKAIDIAKERAMESAVQNIAFGLIYEKLGNTYTDEDKKAIEDQKANIKSQYDQNGGYDKFLKDNNISDEFIGMLIDSSYCSQKLYNDYTANIDVSDEQIKKYYDEHFDEYFASYRRAKHVLILTMDESTQQPLPDDKKEEAKKKADDIYKRALGGEDFDSLVEQYSEDPGSKSQPDGYVFTDGEMVQEFQDCTDSLKSDEIGFCETSYGYHIIKRLDIDLTKDNAKQIVTSRFLSDEFLEYIDSKMEEYGIKTEEIIPLSEL